VRGLALFVGAFLLLDMALALREPEWGAGHWLLDLRFVPPTVADAWLALTGMALCVFACAPRHAARWRPAFATVFAVNALIAVVNAVAVVRLGTAGVLRPALIPFSTFVAAAFAWIAVSRPRPAGRAPLLVPVAAGAFAVLFALGQMACFGRSDYRRPAGAIIVPGARAYADGRPSRALADRMRTACELYREGRAPLLVVSGGPGDGTFHETDVMRKMALAGGVPASAIVVDRGGVNSRATAENAAVLLGARGVDSTLVVSHAYHLPRLKLIVERQGLRAYTVPARESQVIAKMPYFVAREAAAWWAYFLGVS